MTKEKIFVQIDDERIELTGADKEAFIADRETIKSELDKQKAEVQAHKALKISAYTKLGLTEEEINAIL
jgi:hypothetical protein